MPKDFAVIVPMANESDTFAPFIYEVTKVLDKLNAGTIYIVIDQVSKDNTLQLSYELSRRDARFITIWAPENRNIADAYLRGYKEAARYRHPYIIEMDAGLAHDPKQIPVFLE